MEPDSFAAFLQEQLGVEGVELSYEILLGSFLISVVFAFLAAMMAKRRGRSPILWALLGFIFPVLANLALLFMGKSYLEELPAPKEEAVESHVESLDEEKVTIHAPQLEPIWYYLNKKHERFGPMQLSQLQSEWQKGKLDGSNYVWNETMTEWKKASEVEGLEEKLSRP